MNLKKLMLWAMTLAVAIVLPVQAAEDDEEKGEDMRPLVSIDAKHIVNKTPNQSANFSALIDRLNNELTESGLYRVMTMEDIARVWKQNDQMKVLADETQETKIKAPGFIVSMVITTYGMAASAGQNALTGAVSQSEGAKIELILKVTDARTAETIKSKNIEATAAGQAAVASNLREQVLQMANKKAVQKIVYELVKLTPFGVLDVTDGVVQLDVPGTLMIMGKKVAPGQQFGVYKRAKGKKSKRTGKVTYSEKLVATVGVTTVGEESCTAKILSGEIKPIGDDEDTQYDPYIVKINEGSTAAPAPIAPAPVPVDNGAAPF